MVPLAFFSLRICSHSWFYLSWVRLHFIMDIMYIKLWGLEDIFMSGLLSILFCFACSFFCSYSQIPNSVLNSNLNPTVVILCLSLAALSLVHKYLTQGSVGDTGRWNLGITSQIFPSIESLFYRNYSFPASEFWFPGKKSRKLFPTNDSA